MNRFGCVFLVLLAFFSWAGTSRGMVVAPPTFEELVSEASDIFRVQVLETRSQWDEATAGRVIHTYVKCQIQRRMKGASAETVELRLLGGQVGDMVMEISDMPTFQVGEKCILFVVGNGTTICPLVGAMHGCYRLANDPASGTEKVLRNDRLPLTNVRGSLSAKSEDHPAAEAVAALQTALTTDQFENAIITQLEALSKR